MRHVHKLAFVLGGGGSRGALQAGALHALLERGIRPDLLIGTSAGAANAAFIGLDPTCAQVARLEEIWRAAARTDFLPAHWASMVARALLNRARLKPNPSLCEFVVAHLPDPDLRFREMRLPVYLVAADLNHAQAVIYGEEPEQSVLEGILASTALPPWMRPLERGDQLLMDGGAVSNLPIEPAMTHGATEIMAFDLSVPSDAWTKAHGVGPFASKLLNTVARRQAELELQLAAAHKIPVHRLELRSDPAVMFWDFTHAEELIEQGYQIARRFLDEVWSPRPTIMNGLRGWWHARQSSFAQTPLNVE